MMKKNIFLFVVPAILLFFGCSDMSPLDVYDEGPEIVEPLVRAASKNNLKEVNRLLENGHDVNAVSKSGFSSLSIAVRYEYPEVVELLLENGADVWFVDRYGLNPLETAVTRDEAGENADIVRHLVKFGANPDKKGPNMLDSPRQYAKDVNDDILLSAMEDGENERP